MRSQQGCVGIMSVLSWSATSPHLGTEGPPASPLDPSLAQTQQEFPHHEASCSFPSGIPCGSALAEVLEPSLQARPNFEMQRKGMKSAFRASKINPQCQLIVTFITPVFPPFPSWCGFWSSPSCCLIFSQFSAEVPLFADLILQHPYLPKIHQNPEGAAIHHWNWLPEYGTKHIPGLNSRGDNTFHVGLAA